MTDREKFEKVAHWLVQVIEGDDYMLDNIFAFLRAEGLTDEDGFWVYPDDD